LARYDVRIAAKLDAAGAATPAGKTKLQKRLAVQCYNGLYILDEARHELVVFSGSVHKLQIVGTSCSNCQP
jgi:hypothetical protein